MKREAMESVIVLNTVVNRLTDYLDEEERKLGGGAGGTKPQRFSPFQMEDLLEKLRALDERLYREALEAGAGSVDPTNIHPYHFHSIFRGDL